MMPVPTHHHPQDAFWIAQQFNQLPIAHHAVIAREYAHRFRTAGAHAGERRRNANLYLLGLGEQAHGKRFTLSGDDLRHKAARLALYCRTLSRLTPATAEAHHTAVALFQHQGFDPAALAGHEPSGILARLSDSTFWQRHLQRQQDRDQEAFAIQLGVVRRGRGLYVSDALFQTLQARRQASRKALAQLEAVNDASGETVDLLHILNGSVANPEIRRVELMVRMRGFEAAATQAGHTGMFYTLTCPSRYHRFTTDPTTGKPADNPRYAGATPRQAQAYLTGLWARIRAKLKRDDLTAYGFRVAEPHHDGCPHWHLLLFTPPAQQAAVTAIIQHYALLEDGDEAGAQQYRFQAVQIDSRKGSATGYIAKYIAKNINGYGLAEDQEGGVAAADSAQRVRDWASLWHIRQFQQIGGAPVGVWRELRRLTTAPAGLLEDARQAADAGDWGTYLQLQGGVSALRKAMPLRVYTVERVNADTGEVISNKYGEVVGKVDGVALLDADKVQTRLHVWRIQAKARSAAPDALGHEAVQYVAGFNLLQPGIRFGGAAAPPWSTGSTGNNCTQANGRAVQP